MTDDRARSAVCGARIPAELWENVLLTLGAAVSERLELEPVSREERCALPGLQAAAVGVRFRFGQVLQYVFPDRRTSSPQLV